MLKSSTMKPPIFRDVFFRVGQRSLNFQKLGDVSAMTPRDNGLDKALALPL